MNTRLWQLMADKTMPRDCDEEKIMRNRDVLNTIHESYDYIPVCFAYIKYLRKLQHLVGTKEIDSLILLPVFIYGFFAHPLFNGVNA